MTKLNVSEAVVVVTGASSGIGRATAIGFARRGALLALAARDDDALADVAAECALAGGRAIAVPTDVTNPAAVRYLAESTIQTYGRIDVWVNNAGVGAIGGFDETPIRVHDQVIRTNLLGYLHGAHAVLPFFKKQQKGVLINNISFGAWLAAPYAVAYSASKYALVGYSEALRAELKGYSRIHVCDVFPSFINTPGLSQNAANYSGSRITSSGLAISPHKVAHAIVALAEQPRDTVTVGAFASFTKVLHSLCPTLSREIAARLSTTALNASGSAPTTDGALFVPRRDDKRIYGTAPSGGRNVQLAAGGAAIVLGFVVSRLIKFRLMAPRR